MDESGVWDAIAVGCGPAGAVTGRELARRGFKVLILEEHREVGRPVQCAGLVTRRPLEIVKAPDAIQNSLDSAQLISPGGRSITFGGRGERAVVIDRAAFDRAAAAEAIDAGCRLVLGARVTGLEMSPAGRYSPDGGVEISVAKMPKNSRMKARLVIGTDGVQSTVARLCGLAPPPEILPGFEAELAGVTGPLGTVRILVGRDVAPGFFAWLIPSGDGRGLLGLCCEPGELPARLHFERLRKNPALAPHIGRASVLRYIAGCVPVSASPASFADRVLLVGDAAGQVKPISGGGIYTGLKCALLAGQTAAEALEEDDLSRRRLAAYEKKWKGDIGREIGIGRRIRRSYVHVTDAQMDELVRMLDRPKLLALISARGDIDAPSELAKLLFRQAPGLLKFAGPLIKSLFK
jgi:digeranylgeranylglycerophospholipid reductase